MPLEYKACTCSKKDGDVCLAAPELRPSYCQWNYFMDSGAKSGQLIECINPEHLYLGSIHYKQPMCVGKEIGLRDEARPYAVLDIPGLTMRLRSDSDESWQASEALLKR